MSVYRRLSNKKPIKTKYSSMARVPIKADKVDEAMKLAQKMDDDLEEWVASRPKRDNSSITDMTAEELAEELNNHPAFIKEIDPTKPLPPLLEGLQALKYDCESPVEKAENYKEDGNVNFKRKQYKIAIDNYTEAIKIKCPDKLINAQLYTNRAAAQMRHKNYGSALKDCVFATKFVPNHMKAILKGSECSVKLAKYQQVMNWCDIGLEVEPTNETLLATRQEAQNALKSQERDRRKEEMRQRKEDEKIDKLYKAIRSRGIEMDRPESEITPTWLRQFFEPLHPSGSVIHLDDAGVLHCPVMFVYPEIGQTDMIEDFTESDRFIEHIETMFGEGVAPAPWDRNRKYTSDAIQIYYEDKNEERLVNIPSTNTLLQILTDKRFTLHCSTIAFILLIRGDSFTQTFLDRYKTS
ncbi:unnamed protein product [Owenia fusiformis]|uniref:Uncharacterized protein n=1 Tax=Owenia fusiformis TaxID=6347 RepID=A0A8J1TPZ6_OWEFU|nr:unnamed protein product [Owenia fusiformis]